LASLLAAPVYPADAAMGCAAVRAARPYAARTFLGYACGDNDCGQHKAGFAWAELNAITDPRSCRFAEDADFGEGCRAYAEENVTAEQSGFEWARENELVERCQCRGAGSRFEAGCEAYIAGFAD
jgi:hypothetical protein